MDVGASSAHEHRKLEAVEDAVEVLARARAEDEQDRDARDQAVRAAVKAGVASDVVAKAAGISPGRVSHLTVAPRSS